MQKFLIFILVWQSCQVQYSVGVSDPFLLTSSQINIVTVQPDLQDQYLVSFIDGQARRYSADFSTSTALTVPQTVQQFASLAFQVNGFQLPNGTFINILSNMTVTLSNNYKTLRVYTYPNFIQVQCFNFTQPILDYQGLPLDITSLEPLHIIVFNQTTKVIHRGITTTAFDTNQSYGSYNVAVVFKKYVMSYGGDFVNLTFAYVHKLSVLGLIQVNITLNFKYNYTSSTYDLSVSSNYYTTSPNSMNVKTMLIANGVVLMQMNSTFMLRIYGQTVSFGDYFDPYIMQNDILEFFYIFNSYYILFTKGLVKATINDVNSYFLFTTLVNTLPIASYQLTFGVNIDTLFVPGTPYLYKAKCLNQTIYSSGTCASYNCSVANCALCPLTANTCQTCSNGFTKSDLLTCVNILPNTTTNPTNNSSNSTNVITIINSTTNSTTTSINRPSRFNSLLPFLLRFQWIQSLFFGTLNATKDLMAVPLARRISPTFYFFGNFDDLYLYSFHDRLYGNTMTNVFVQISEIEKKKWSLLGYGAILELLGISNSSFFAQIDYQSVYVSYKYKTSDHSQQGSESLLANCPNFFIIAVPFTIMVFIVLGLIFRLLFEYSISRLLRKFSLVGCLFAGLFDGNIQQFAFYCVAEWMNVFFFSFGDKCIKLFAIFFGFLVVIISIGGLLISFGMYRKLNKYLADNNRNNFSGVSFLLTQYGLRNFVFGVLHSLLRPLPYAYIITVFLSIELAFTLMFVLSCTQKIYKRASFMWYYIVISLIRILLIATLIMDNGMINEDSIENLQCTLILLIIFFYLLGTLSVVITYFIDLIKDIAKIIRNDPKNKQSQLCLKVLKVTANTLKNKAVVNQFTYTIQKQKNKSEKQKTFNLKKQIIKDCGNLRRYEIISQDQKQLHNSFMILYLLFNNQIITQKIAFRYFFDKRLKFQLFIVFKIYADVYGNNFQQIELSLREFNVSFKSIIRIFSTHYQ